MESKDVKLTAAPGVLLQAPAWDDTRRGINWMAVIGTDPGKPGGLSRRFMPRGRGICLYQVEQLAPGDPVEFGADHVSSSGRRTYQRWYGVVVRIEEDQVVMTPMQDANCALVRAAYLRRKARGTDTEEGQSA